MLIRGTVRTSALTGAHAGTGSAGRPLPRQHRKPPERGNKPLSEGNAIPSYCFFRSFGIANASWGRISSFIITASSDTLMRSGIQLYK